MQLMEKIIFEKERSMAVLTCEGTYDGYPDSKQENLDWDEQERMEAEWLEKYQYHWEDHE